MAVVFIPTQMRDLTNGTAQVEIAAANVAEAIDQLEALFPGVRDRLCKDGALAPALQVSVDGVFSTRGLRAKLGPTSELHFLPAMVGG